MTDAQQHDIAQDLIAITTKHGLKGCILITFERDFRKTMPCTIDPQYALYVDRVAVAIHNDMLAGEIQVPDVLN